MKRLLYIMSIVALTVVVGILASGCASKDPLVKEFDHSEAALATTLEVGSKRAIESEERTEVIPSAETKVDSEVAESANSEDLEYFMQTFESKSLIENEHAYLCKQTSDCPNGSYCVGFTAEAKYAKCFCTQEGGCYGSQ